MGEIGVIQVSSNYGFEGKTRTKPKCGNCGDSRALRWQDGWVCSQGCGNQSKAAPRQHGGNRATLFEAYVVDNGQRRRATRSELREAWRLWAVHKDIRENRL